MFCKKCGYNLQEDADFCMNCGTKVKKDITPVHMKSEEGNDEIKCRKCGKMNPKGAQFCSECGNRIKPRNWKPVFGIVAVFICILVCFALVILHKNSLKSPIEHVSKKIYEQGQEYLEKMDSASVKEAVADYANLNPKAKMNEVYSKVEVDFELDLGKNPTEEEEFYAELIRKFWQSKAICYSQEAVMAKFADSDETAMKMTVTLYKGIESDFKDSIDEAEKVLNKASDMADMKEAYRILDEIWES